jgi:hypothetical protein
MASNLTVETVLMITVGVAVLGIANLCALFFVHKKIERLLGGKTEAKDIESAQALINADLNELKQFRAELERYLETVELRLKRSVQGVETLRFNPFKGNGDGLMLDDLVVVHMPMNYAKKVYMEWKHNPRPGGPEKTLPVDIQETIITGVLQGLFREEEIKEIVAKTIERN